MNYSKRFRVEPGSRVRLKDFDPNFAEKYAEKQAALVKIEKYQQRMDELQFQLYAEQKRSLLICLQAPDAGGAQAIGHEGVDKRIDVLATALKASMTMHDLAELELAYAPPFGSAKDPVNLAGMIAENVMAGDVSIAQWSEIERLDAQRILLLDVREPDERQAGHIPGSLHIPLDQLRSRLKEMPKDREIIVHCQSGQRSYYACRILTQHGFQARNLTGSYRTWRIAHQTQPTPSQL